MKILDNFTSEEIAEIANGMFAGEDQDLLKQYREDYPDLYENDDFSKLTDEYIVNFINAHPETYSADQFRQWLNSSLKKAIRSAKKAIEVFPVSEEEGQDIDELREAFPNKVDLRVALEDYFNLYNDKAAMSPLDFDRYFEEYLGGEYITSSMRRRIKIQSSLSRLEKQEILEELLEPVKDMVQYVQDGKSVAFNCSNTMLNTVFDVLRQPIADADLTFSLREDDEESNAIPNVHIYDVDWSFREGGSQGSVTSSLDKAIKDLEKYFGTTANDNVVCSQDIILENDVQDIKQIAEDNNVICQIGQYSVTVKEIPEALTSSFKRGAIFSALEGTQDNVPKFVKIKTQEDFDKFGLSDKIPEGYDFNDVKNCYWQVEPDEDVDNTLSMRFITSQGQDNFIYVDRDRLYVERAYPYLLDMKDIGFDFSDFGMSEDDFDEEGGCSLMTRNS